MSSTRLLILGVVRIFQPVHGYDVRRELLSWRANEWASVSPGSIYNALKSLTRDGLLEVVGTGQVGARPERTTYRLTADGEKEFQSLLRETWWTVQRPIDPLMPALAFLNAMRRDELVAAIDHRIAHIESFKRATEFSIADHGTGGDDTTPAHVKEMFRLSAARVESEVAWARALLEKIDRGEYAVAPPANPAAKAPAKAGKKRQRGAGA